MSDAAVWVIPNRKGNSNGIYHTKRSCDRIPSNPIKRDMKEVEKLGWDECQFCTGDVNYAKSGRKSLRRILDEAE